MENLNSDIAKELLTYIAYFDEDVLVKIPESLLIKLNTLASFSNRNYYIDKSKDLIEQDMSDDCKNLLATICMKYICN